MKVAKKTAERARKLLKDFSATDNPILYNSALGEMLATVIELESTTPGKLRKTINEIKNRIGDVGLCLKQNESGLAVKTAVGVGMQFTLLCAELALIRGSGKTEHPVNAIIRQVYKEQPNVKKQHIVATAIERFKKTNPEKKCPSLNSKIAHFAEIIKMGHV